MFLQPNNKLQTTANFISRHTLWVLCAMDCFESFQKHNKSVQKKVYKICLTNLAISTLSTFYVRGTCENLQQFLKQKIKKKYIGKEN